jgi:hypothetical protein
MYIAKVLEKFDQNYFKIGIFRVENEREEQIGEYVRSLHTRPTTFFPFQQNGEDFALYSPHYSDIRIMKLPSCKDIGGDESKSDDFCSIDFYVPSYMEQKIISKIKNSEGKVEEKLWTTKVSEQKDEELTEYIKSSTDENINTGKTESSETIYRPLTSRLYYPFGFVYGCRWMDDTSVHFLDLSEVENGIVKREARFGYVEKPIGVSLKEAINMENYGRYSGDAENQFQMCLMQTFDLITGKKIIEDYE